MNELLTPGAALLLGLVASGHCALMCGGITAALGLASARGPTGRPQLRLLLGYQLGRISSYTLAGCLLAGALGSVVAWLDIEAVRRALRLLAAMALLLGALAAFGLSQDPTRSFGRRVWAVVSPLGRRLLPIDSVPRAVAFGMIWGWMPCGFVYSLLLIAALQMDAARGALTMAAFGLGTIPALLTASYGATRMTSLATRPLARRVAGAVLLVSAVMTMAGPWWMESNHGAHAAHAAGRASMP